MDNKKKVATQKVINVTATEEFKKYRNGVLELKKEDFRALQSGKIVKVSDSLIKKYPHIFKEMKNAG